MQATADFKTVATQTDNSKYAMFDLTLNVETGVALKYVTFKNLRITSAATDNRLDYGFYANSIHRNFQFFNCQATYFEYGYFIKTLYASRIECCEALYCTQTGFWITDGSTSTELVSCYASTCVRGYKLKAVVYSCLTACAADYCRLAYDIELSTVNLVNCGCEESDVPLYITACNGNIIGGGFFATDNPGTSVANLITLQETCFMTIQSILLSGGAGVTGSKVSCGVTAPASRVTFIDNKGFTVADVLRDESVYFTDVIRQYNFWPGTATAASFIVIPTTNDPDETRLVAGGLYYNTTTNKFRKCDGSAWSDVG
jgi:hypothetical protein